MAHYKNYKGFTLVEMLVVLVLMSLTSSLLFEGLSFIGQLRGHIKRNITQTKHLNMPYNWFVDCVSTLAPSDNQKLFFTGDKVKFSSISQAPLVLDVGAPATVEWTLRREGDAYLLLYTQWPGNEWVVKSWRGLDSVEFIYLSEENTWVEQWKSNSDFDHLPRAVAVKLLGEDAGEWWIASIKGQRKLAGWMIPFVETP